MLRGEVNSHSLVQMGLKNRRRQATIQDALKRSNNWKALLHDIEHLARNLLTAQSLSLSTSLLGGLGKVFQKGFVNFDKWSFFIL